MVRRFHASSRPLCWISMGSLVLACAVVCAQASLAATPTDSVTGLSLDFCASQDLDRTHSFQSTAGSNNGWQFISYTCVSSCTPTNLANCSHVFLDVNGSPLTYTRNGQTRSMRSVEFVVDNMGGSIVYSPDGEAAKTVVFHGGVGGTAYGGTPLSTQLLNNTQAKVVWISWLDGAAGVFNSGKAGWFSRKNATGVTIKTQSKRPATVIRWVHDNLAGGNPIGTAGCSMGTVATLAPGVWWQSDSYFKYQQFIGGPANWNVNASCGKGNPIATGFCDSDPQRACNTSLDCANVDDTCNRPSDDMAQEFYDFMTYLAGISISNQFACHKGDPTIYPPYNGSSFDPQLNPGTFAFSHPVDFLTDERTGQSCTHMPPDDHCMGLGSEELVLNAIVAGSPLITTHWNDSSMADHCQSWKDGTGLSWLKVGMGL
jgi:hypothetical protein